MSGMMVLRGLGDGDGLPGLQGRSVTPNHTQYSFGSHVLACSMPS
jgi:hypothetical protein